MMIYLLFISDNNKEEMLPYLHLPQVGLEDRQALADQLDPVFHRDQQGP